MTISGYTPSSVIDAATESSEPLANQIGVSLLKKAQDQIKRDGAATIKLLESAGAQPDDHHRLDVYA